MASTVYDNFISLAYAGVNDNLTAASYTLTFPSAAPDGDKLIQTNSDGDLSFVDAVSSADTTYTHTWVDSSTNAILRLTAGGSGSGDDDLTIVAGSNITLTPDGDNLTIAATDTNTVYTHPSYNGDDFSLDSTHLAGAYVVDDIDINVTTDALGHVTDANGTVATRQLTAADIGAAAASHGSHSGEANADDTAIVKRGTYTGNGSQYGQSIVTGLTSISHITFYEYKDIPTDTGGDRRSGAGKVFIAFDATMNFGSIYTNNSANETNRAVFRPFDEKWYGGRCRISGGTVYVYEEGYYFDQGSMTANKDNVAYHWVAVGE